MQNGNIKVEALFNGDRIFNIPKYQRAYAWTEENLSDFLDDLSNQRGERSYFLGTLLFHEKDKRRDYEIIDVVDGQQRLTTMILFMNECIKILKERDSELISAKTYRRYIYDGECYKLEFENEDSGFLHNYILNDKKGSTPETPSQRKLLDAKGYFSEKISKMSTEKVEFIYNVLINADVILYTVNKVSDATQIFELLNDRGRKLTNLEGVKSFLMYKIGCLGLKGNGEQTVKDIQDNIAGIYRIIEKNDIDENDVLRYHTITFENSKSDDYNSPEKFIKNKINDMFENQIEDLDIKFEVIGYVERLKKSFEIFEKIKSNVIKCEKLDHLVMIGRVNPFYPLMMSIYETDSSKFESFISDLTKFTFKATLIGLRNDNENFYTYIRNKEDITGLFEKVVQGNWWNINNRADDILKYRNFYEWVNKNIVKYILFSYENMLRTQKGYPLLTKENYFTTDNRKKLSIEHITAQRTKSLVFDNDFEENYLHSLGNLVIDTVAANSRKGCDGVDEKMSEYVQAPIMSQNQINEHNIDWKNIDEVKDYINKRNDLMIEFIRTNLF